MSYGNNSSSSNNNLLIFKIITRDAEKKPISPVFSITKKGEDGKWAKTEDTCTRVEGSLKSILFKDKEWEGNAYKIVNLLLEDAGANEAYLLELRFNGLTRSLFNSLLSVNVAEPVTISLWEGKDGHARVTLWQGEQKVAWKHAIADMPQPLEIIHPKTKKVEKRDYTDVDEFFENELKTFIQENSLSKKGKASDETQAPSGTGSDDDILF